MDNKKEGENEQKDRKTDKKKAESIDFSTYAEGTERYWIYTREDHTDLTDGDLKQMNGCRIGAADGSYQKELLKKWLDSNQIQAVTAISVYQNPDRIC